MSRSRRVTEVRDRVTAAVTFARRADVPFLAAAIAYYALVSILPALLLVLSVGTFLGGEVIAKRILASTREFLTPAGEGAIEGAITDDDGRTGASLVGVALLVWSTLRVFRGLDKAFSRVYGTIDESGFLDQVVDATIVLASIGAGLMGMVVLGGVLATMAPFGGDLLGLGGLLVGLAVVFFPLYYVFPDADVAVIEALPGIAVVAVGWVLLQAGFQLYAAAAPRYDLYGVVGGILLLVTWFYLAAMLLLGGAVLNAVLAGRANRQLQQAGNRE